jgi:hypothetical protein
MVFQHKLSLFRITHSRIVWCELGSHALISSLRYARKLRNSMHSTNRSGRLHTAMNLTYSTSIVLASRDPESSARRRLLWGLSAAFFTAFSIEIYWSLALSWRGDTSLILWNLSRWWTIQREPPDIWYLLWMQYLQCHWTRPLLFR